MSIKFLPLAAVLAISHSAVAQNWGREDVDFAAIQQKAKELGSQPYVAPGRDTLPEWLNKLTYDQYRDIRFNPAQALWAADKNLPFRAMFFHPGYLFREPVMLNEFTGTHEQRIRLTEEFFNYGPLVGQRGELPADAGFAGVRYHAQLNGEHFDELAVFQGASYWRALGKAQRWGISSRGLAVDTGLGDKKEEFPAFREFWLRKPNQGDASAVLYALLDGPSYAGAYAFRITPGQDTAIDVRAVLFVRREVTRLGIAPMSSMFWFGENSRRRFDDFRPEVHDSDGLAILMGSGEKIWRPISNDTGKVEFSFFSMDECKGFGLLQRDRRFAAYEDAEAAYHLRPSLWIEPTSDWGPGKVMLMEIPTGNELADNSVAMWEPRRVPQPGERLEFSYRQHWTMNEDPARAGGHVVATRTGVHDWQPEQRTVAVEFTGGSLQQIPENETPSAMVEVVGDAIGKVKIQSITVQRMPEGRWRAAFQLAPAAEGTKLADIGPVELRCCLKRGEDFLTETWSYRIHP